MSTETERQSRLVIEAAGGSVPKHRYDVDDACCVNCGRHISDDAPCRYPDLSLPENRGLLVEKVRLICDTDEKWATFFANFLHSFPFEIPKPTKQERRELNRLKAVFTAPEISILRAVGKVIEEESDE